MKKFNDADFLLETETAKHLYHDYCENLPIIDYHCHLVPKEIYDDVHYDNITQVWLGADHYKWRQMRSNGVEEKYVTGDGADREKFQKWAETLEMAIGNPLYHWSHLELKKYFGYEGALDGETAQEVWDLCNAKLQTPEMSARNLILQSNVDTVCTTDDPADSLEWHKKIKEDNFATKVLPAWRPDKAMCLNKPDYLEYLEKLGNAAGIQITSYAELIDALKNRMTFFNENGCSISDHGMDFVPCVNADEEEVAAIFARRLNGETIAFEDEMKFRTAFLLALGKEYAKKNWVMQLHYGVQRDLNSKIFNAFGPDGGIDAIGDSASVVELGRFLNALASQDALPKTIIYSLNPNDNAAIGTIIGCFQDSACAGKVQQGSAWWFNDNKTGMIDQMTSLANLGLLGNFVGMLTDSRSFLSYTRHEYFRRIMCNLIGGWVENGEYPNNEASLKKLVQGISYYNAKRYFNL